MDLIIIYRDLFRKKWIIIGVSLFSVLLAAFLTKDYQDVYVSSSQIATGFTVAEQVSVTDERFNIFEAEIKFNNMISEINSPQVFALLSYELILHDQEGSEPPFRTISNESKYAEIMAGKEKDEIIQYVHKKIDSLEVLSNYNENDKQLSGLLRLYQYAPTFLREIIKVSRIRGTDYILFTAYTENPELSAYIVNTHMEVYLKYNQKLSDDKSLEYARTFANLVEQKRIVMEQKSEALRNYKASNRVIDFKMESASNFEQILNLENRRDEERMKTQNLRYEVDALNNRISLFPNASTNNSNQEKNRIILELKEQISIVNNKYIATGSQNEILLDSLQKLRSRLQEMLVLDVPIESTSTNTVDELVVQKQQKEIELEIARKNLASINSKLTELKRNADTYNSKETIIESLTRELNTATGEYQDAQEKYNTVLDLALASSKNLRIALAGQPAAQPEPSKKIIISGLAGIASFSICIIVIVFLGYIDPSIKFPSNFKKLTEFNNLGILLSINLKKNDLMKIILGPSDKKIFGHFKDILRKLRYEVEAKERKLILITSTQREQGKTTLLLSLAGAFSIVNKKILIIDMNFTDNTLSQKFKAKPVLEKIPSNADNLVKYISETGIPNIKIIGSKGGNYSPSEIFTLDRFLENIKSKSKEFDYVLIEGASMNEYSDSKELSPFVDGVIAVFSANSVIRQIDYQAIEYFKSIGNQFMGTVLNDVEEYNIDQ